MGHQHFEWGMVAVAVLVAIILIYIFGITPVVIGPYTQHYTPPSPITNYYDPKVTTTVAFPRSSGLTANPLDRTATCRNTGNNPWTEHVTGLDVWLQSQYQYSNTSMSSPGFITANSLDTSNDIHQKTPGELRDTAVSHVQLQCGNNTHTAATGGTVTARGPVVSTPLTNSVADYYMLWHGSDGSYRASGQPVPAESGRDLSDYSPQVNWGEDTPPLVCNTGDVVVAGKRCGDGTTGQALPQDFNCQVKPISGLIPASQGDASWEWHGGHMQCGIDNYSNTAYVWNPGMDIYNRPAKDGGIYVDPVHDPAQRSYLRGLRIGVDETGNVRTMAGLTEDGSVIGPVGAPHGSTIVSEAWCDPFSAIVGLNMHYSNGREYDVYNGYEIQNIDNLEIICAPVL